MSGLTALAAAPAVYLMFLIYKLDKKEKEPIGFLLKLLMFGALTIIPAVILELLGTAILSMFDINEYLTTIIYFIVVVAGAEELVKFAALYISSWNKPTFNCRFDGVVYAVAVSLGFALLENILYVAQNGVGVGIMRALTAVPLHCAAGIYMGQFYANAKKHSNLGERNKARAEILKSYFIPVALHGVYDCLCSIEYPGYIVVFLVFVVIMYVITIINVRKYAKNDAFIGMNIDAMPAGGVYSNYQGHLASYGVPQGQINVAFVVGRVKAELYKTGIYFDRNHSYIIDSMFNLSAIENNVPKVQLIVGGARLFSMNNGVCTFEYRTNSIDDVVFYMLDYTVGVISSQMAAHQFEDPARIRSQAFARIGGYYEYWHRCGRHIFNMRPY